MSVIFFSNILLSSDSDERVYLYVEFKVNLVIYITDLKATTCMLAKPFLLLC